MATTVNYSQPVALSDYALWLGVPNVSEAMLKQFDPAYTGHVHIFATRVPKIFEKWYPDHAKNFRAVIERASTSITGIPELTMNYQDQQHGFADRKIPHATFSEMPFDTATIRVMEFRGLPVYTMFKDWIENISDPHSKVQDYKGRVGPAATQLEYTIMNHSAAFIVCTTDPSHTRIQGRAHYITAAQPVAIPNEHFNWNAGEIGIVEGYDLAFRGVLRWGDYIDAKAQELLTARKAVINYLAEYSNAGNVKSLSKPYGL